MIELLYFQTYVPVSGHGVRLEAESPKAMEKECPGHSCLVVLRLVIQSCPTVCDPMDCSPPGSSVPQDSSGKNTGVDFHALIQRIFLTQGLNPGRWIFYQLSYQGNPSGHSYMVQFQMLQCDGLCFRLHGLG